MSEASQCTHFPSTKGFLGICYQKGFKTNFLPKAYPLYKGQRSNSKNELKFKDMARTHKLDFESVSKKI